MVEEYPGKAAAEVPYFGSPNDTGEGIRWGTELGAATEPMGSYQARFGGGAGRAALAWSFRRSTA